MMALTRGVNALFPCPTCLVPKEEIPNLSIRHRLRLTQEMQTVWTEGLVMNATDRENHLQSYGLRDVQVMFQIIVILSGLWRVWMTFYNFSERILGTTRSRCIQCLILGSPTRISWWSLFWPHSSGNSDETLRTSRPSWGRCWWGVCDSNLT